MKFSNSWMTKWVSLAVLGVIILAEWLPSSLLQAQAPVSSLGNVINYMPPVKLMMKPGGQADSTLKLDLRPGFHVNSNMPSEDYLIPLRLTWSAGAIESTGFLFPKAETQKYSFSQKPLSVYTGNFEIVTHFKAGAAAQPGVSTVTGKLRYQACNDHECLPPKTLEISLPVEVAP